MSNVKVGDLAYVVNKGVTTPGLAGRIVTVIAPAIMGDTVITDCGVKLHKKSENKCWRVASNSSLPITNGLGEIFMSKERFILDMLLRPIRDSDGEDEMLKITDLPKVLEKVE